MSILLRLNIDWADAYGWKCAFCGGDIDHLSEERDQELGYADDSYTCQDKSGELCESVYFMVRWSLSKRGNNGDALTLSRWIEIEVGETYISNPDRGIKYGLYGKYLIFKADTYEPINGKAFVLKPESDPHARAALQFYADSVRTDNLALALDLDEWLIPPTQKSEDQS